MCISKRTFVGDIVCQKKEKEGEMTEEKKIGAIRCPKENILGHDKRREEDYISHEKIIFWARKFAQGKFLGRIVEKINLQRDK
jgi:hypothetical protein